MPSRVIDLEQDRAKRDLRLRIGRLRRRIDGRLYASRREASRLTSWRTYVARFPGGALAAAFGVGLALAAGMSGPRLLRLAGLRLVRQGARDVGAGLWRELASIWAGSARDNQTAGTEGGDRGRA
jgi:hypothetical protein